MNDTYDLAHDGPAGKRHGLLSRMPWRRGHEAELRERSNQPVSVSSADMKERCDRACTASLPLLAAAGGLMLLLSIRLGGRSLETAAGISTATISGVVGCILLVFAWNLTRHKPAGRNCHQAALVVLLVTGLSLSIEMMVSGSLQQTAYMELLVVVAGAVMLRSRWMAIAVGSLWALWLGVTALLSGTVTASGWFLGMLGATVISIAIHVMRLEGVRALSAALNVAEAEAVEDVLTGLLNRRGLLVVGEEILAIAHRTREAVACTFVDVDGLKVVNDAQGHDVGDEVLVTVSEALVDVFRESDVIARWGGDEFVVLALGAGPSAEDVERRLSHRLESMDQVSVSETSWGVSAGRVVHMPWQDENLEEILARADQEMYRRRRLRRAKGKDQESR